MLVSLSWYAGTAGVEGEGEELVEASGGAYGWSEPPQPVLSLLRRAEVAPDDGQKGIQVNPTNHTQNF